MDKYVFENHYGYNTHDNKLGKRNYGNMYNVREIDSEMNGFCQKQEKKKWHTNLKNMKK